MNILVEKGTIILDLKRRTTLEPLDQRRVIPDATLDETRKWYIVRHENEERYKVRAKDVLAVRR